MAETSNGIPQFIARPVPNQGVNAWDSSGLGSIIDSYLGKQGVNPTLQNLNQGSWFDDIFNMDAAFGNAKAGTTGWAPTALGALQGLGSAYLGMKQYGLAKDEFEESKRQFELNYGAQKKLTNSRLEDRQRARVASNPGAYESVGSYMQKNGI